MNNNYISIQNFPELDLKRNIFIKKIISKKILTKDEENTVKIIFNCIDKIQQLKKASDYFDNHLKCILKNFPELFIQDENNKIYTNCQKLNFKGKLSKLTEEINIVSHLNPEEAKQIGFEMFSSFSRNIVMKVKLFLFLLIQFSNSILTDGIIS